MKDTIYFNPIALDNKINNVPGTIICGSPGNGKTYFMSTLIDNLNMLKTICIILDPKNDCKDIAYQDGIKVIDLAKKMCLDPFICIKDVDALFITDVISSICNGLTDEDNVVIQPIVSDFIKKAKYGNASFAKMTNYLYSNDNPVAMKIGNMLKATEKTEWGPVLFGDPTGKDKYETINFQRESMVISLFGLQLPQDQNKANWSKSECFASTIVMIIIKMLQQVLVNKNNVPVTLFIDEAHILLENPAIFKIVESFLILGRSLNVYTVMASQNVTHFPDDFCTYIGSKFLFKNNSKTEISIFLDRFLSNGSEDRDYLINKCLNAKRGEAIYIDRKNRVGLIKISGDLKINSNPINNGGK